MKRILPILSLLFLFASCSEEKSYFGPNSADSLMENMGLRIQLSKQSYDNYIMIQGTMTGNQAMYDSMLKSLDEQLELAKKTNGYDDSEKYEQPNDGIKLKKAGIKIIETYISVAKDELKQVKDENLRWESERCQWFYEGGNIRIQEAYAEYGKIQKKIADEHNITLY